MNLKKLSTLLLSVIALTFVLTGTIFAQSGASVRFVHAIPGAPTVDVYVNDQLAVADLAYGDASSYLSVPAGQLSISANVTGTSDVAFSQISSISDAAVISMVATSATNPQFQAVNDDRREIAFGNTRFSIVHGIEGGPAVDVIFLEDGTPIADNLAYGDAFGTFDVPAGVYELAVLATDSGASIADLTLPLSAGETNVVMVYGTAEAPEVMIASASTAATADSGLVRFAHGVLSANAVDVVINGTSVVPSLAFGDASEHIALPAGSHNVVLSENGVEIASATLDVTAGQAQTAVAVGDIDSIGISVFNDDLSGLTADNAIVSVINAVPNSTINTLALSDGTVITSALASNSSSEAVSVSAGSKSVSFDLTVDDETGVINTPATQLYSGSYYNMMLLPGNAFTGPQLVTAETVVMRGLSDAASEVVAAPETNANDEVVTISTPAPVNTGTGVVTANINLAPGANLHLRQYPSGVALSLGLAPAGSSLTVIGRRGLTEYYESEPQDVPVDLSDFTADPAIGLDKDDDLSAEDTWLYVTYNTPDSGAINAWVNALYLQVYDEEGEEQRLADLVTVRQNEAGEAIATAITPPPEPVDIVTATVFNLNPDAQLNIRRTKGTDGEVIARASLGTVMTAIGADASGDWVFVEYLSPDGGAVTGWVSSQYVELELNDNSATLQELVVNPDVFDIIANDERGEILGSGERPALPSPDPYKDAVVGEVVIDPGAGLQLRRTPSIEGESLNLVPGGTSFIIEGYTNNQDWLKVTYEGIQGWVASQYLVLSFNGDFVELTDVLGEIESFNNNGE